MIRPNDALRVVEELRGSAVVVTTMMGSRAWRRISHNTARDLHVGGAMGKASSVALGLAIAQPQLKVIVVDGDGSILMNLGSLVSIANKAPARFYHLVLENGVYAMTGGQPVPGVGRFNIAGIAREAGYRATYTFSELRDFAAQAPKVLEEPGPVMVCLKVEPEIDNTPIHLRTPQARRTVDIMKDLRELLVATSG